MRKTPAYRLALSGILAGLAVVIMLLGGTVSIAMYCCPMLACLLLVPLGELCTKRWCLGWYAVVSLLSLLLCPDKEPAFVFCFLGWYPIAAESLNKLPKVFRILIKLLIFNVAVFGMYAGMVFLFRMEAVADELKSTGLVMLLVTLGLANVVFFVLDLLLQRMRKFFRHRMKKHQS